MSLRNVKKNTPKPDIVIRREYPAWLRYRLWTLFRSEYYKANLGQDRFASYLDDIVTEELEGGRIIYPDGTNFRFNESFPTARTYYNFFKSGEGGSGDSLHNIERITKIDYRVIQFVHIFLWKIHPTLVSSFKKDIPAISGIVDDFTDEVEIERTSSILPKYFKVFSAPEDLVADWYLHYPATYQDFLWHSRWRLEAVVSISDDPGYPVQRAAFFPPENWDALKRVNPRLQKASFDPACRYASGRCVSFRSRDLIADAKTPRMETRAYWTIIKQVDRLSNCSVHIALHANPVDLKYLIEPEIPAPRHRPVRITLVKRQHESDLARDPNHIWDDNQADWLVLNNALGYLVPLESQECDILDFYAANMYYS